MHSKFYCNDPILKTFHWIISKLSSAKDGEGGGSKKDNLTYFYRIRRDMILMPSGLQKGKSITNHQPSFSDSIFDAEDKNTCTHRTSNTASYIANCSNQNWKINKRQQQRPHKVCCSEQKYASLDLKAICTRESLRSFHNEACEVCAHQQGF